MQSIVEIPAVPAELCGVGGCCYLPHSTGRHTWEVSKPFAEQYEVDRHAEKQGCSYTDAWRYFEREGYDMIGVWPQYFFADVE